jgi:hypothetical protein
MTKPNEIQGEGNKEAAKNYNEAQEKFVKSGRVEQAAEEAEPKSKEEAEELERAEAEGRRHAKEEDPAVHRDGKRVGGNRGAIPKDEDLDIE